MTRVAGQDGRHAMNQGDAVDHTIRLSDYRTSELVDSIARLINVPLTLRTIMCAVIGASVLCVVGYHMVLQQTDVGTLQRVILRTYSVGTGLFTGGMLALALVASSAMSNAMSLLDIVLDTTEAVARDYQRIQAEEAQMPSGADLAEEVISEVVFPAVEQTFASSLGIFSKPVLWVYRRTIGPTLRAAAGMVGAEQFGGTHHTRLETQAERSLEAVAQRADVIRQSVQSVRTRLKSSSGVMRNVALIPIYMGLALSIALAIVPMWIVR